MPKAIFSEAPHDTLEFDVFFRTICKQHLLAVIKSHAHCLFGTRWHIESTKRPVSLTHFLALALQPSFSMYRLLLAASLCGLSCAPGGGPSAGDVLINEIVADNEGVLLDNNLETEDYIELINISSAPINLRGYRISDSGAEVELPEMTVSPGERIVFYADDEVEEGRLHLGFKLSSAGERLVLFDPRGDISDEVTFPALGQNEVFARFPDVSGEAANVRFADFERCPFASPREANGQRCGPPPPPPVNVEPFEPYTFSDPYPALPSGLGFSELSLRSDAPFVVFENFGDTPVDLSAGELLLTPHGPDLDYPTVGDEVIRGGARLFIDELTGQNTLAPGALVRANLSPGALSDLENSEHFEGVASIFVSSASEVDLMDRVDFMAWPSGASLARLDQSRFVFCANPSQSSDEARSDCERVLSREAPGRLRNLRTPGDFDALSSGGSRLGVAAVKFVIDLEHGGGTHFIGADYALHYEFVREVIEGLEALDRCDPEEGALFRRLWTEFSQAQYNTIEGRRYLQGTLAHYVTSDVRSMEFATGDRITADMMLDAFFALTSRMNRGTRWSLRPQSSAQDERLRSVEGMAPMVGQNAINAGVSFQPLNTAVAYGVLRLVPTEHVENSDLVGPGTILLTNAVPNDVPFVEGVITEVLQTPLSHVNVLSRGRNTPNMALIGARSDPRIAPLLDELVRFEVTETSFVITPATRSDAETFWNSRRPSGPPRNPAVDASVRGLVEVAQATMSDVPSIGTKAAQLGVLSRIESRRAGCPGTVPTPESPFAIPVSYYLDHFEESGAQALVQRALSNDDFSVDITVRRERLAEVRQAMMDHPLSPGLLQLLRREIGARFGDARVRFRSSANVEDLADFSGAGLYTSISAQLDSPELLIEDAVRGVWSSLWNVRAFDERTRGNIDQMSSAMGILVHKAFRSELASGIGVSRDIFDLTRSDVYFFNVQAGEASVANPAPGVSSEMYLYRWGRNPRIVTRSESTLTDFDILTDAERDRAACWLRTIHEGFQPIVDPEGDTDFFAMDIEWKLINGRQLVIKQARPYYVGETTLSVCDEF